MNAAEARDKLNNICKTNTIQPLVDIAIERALELETNRVVLTMSPHKQSEQNVLEYLKHYGFWDISVDYIDVPTGIYEIKSEKMIVFTFFF
jgi:hypothetical protein